MTEKSAIQQAIDILDKAMIAAGRLADLVSQDGWQPIESAPRDRPIMLFARCITATASVICVGWYDEMDGWLDLVFHPNTPSEIVPSHWMPLPSFPEAPNA